MIRTKLMVGLLAGMLATAAVGVSAAEAKGPLARLANSPLGQLVSGQVGRLLVLRSELSLTDQQRDQIRKVLVSHKAEVIEQAKAVWEKRVALRHAVLAENTDEAAIRKAAEDLGRSIGDAAVLAAKVKKELAPVLTAQQRESVKKCVGECEKATAKFLEEAGKAK